MAKKFDTLYKKTSIGKIQQWKIWVDGATIFTESGQVGGKMVQSSDTLKSGKNAGTKKATTPEQQALLEAESKFTKQLKKGYVRSIDDAQAGEVDDVIEGGIIPMLAKSYDDCKKHVKFPCAVQPKLDGMRAIFHGGKFWSRTRKPIALIDHLMKEISALNINPNLVLDGELYNHEYSEDFEEILSAARRQKNVSDKVHHIQYHVYDIALGATFEKRMEKLEQLNLRVPSKSCIVIVPTKIVENEEQLREVYDEFLEAGYEGAMVRNLHATYENKRSAHLLKMKEFTDAEFKVVDIEEGRGKLQGHVGAFVCEISDKHGKRTFRAKAEGKQDFLKECFENPKLWKNKMLTVRFQGYTNKNNVPRFPVGVRFRTDLK
jgi:DNA ligase-1